MTPPRGSSMTTWHYRCEPELLDRNKLDPIPGLSEDETVFPEKSNAYYPPKNEGDKTRSPAGRNQIVARCGIRHQFGGSCVVLLAEVVRLVCFPLRPTPGR